MHKVVLLAGFAAIVAASPAAQAIGFATVNAAPSPTLTDPALGVNSQDVAYNTASVAASGSAAVAGVATASAETSQYANKRWLLWPWGNSGSWGSQTTTSQAPTSSSTSKTSVPTSTPPTTTTSQVLTTGTSATTSAETTCATEPEAGTYCGFINPEDACAP
ncbi:hypothetical protein G7Y89_g22 [Cudoniella acicularis]|uniref:Uncharacterized protein n=1 Tax=Cudoniella acicularis TaxID=354080 RepID=A0A8H4RXX8_9HELO|nr:hypothetical protein G7Y89_g22 [Cudoniella acicularis]